ncbi:MAG: hypothetical protein CM1200mP14_28200 [Gammaproteobacteria bacterium]|nr:MAG: hypothetical protein CM1200mP14_28200 [Gammaproteobacteria bacterium]
MILCSLVCVLVGLKIGLESADIMAVNMLLDFPQSQCFAGPVHSQHGTTVPRARMEL